MIGLLAALAGPAAAQASCQEVAAVPDAMQVAWIAPLGKRVGANSELEVVRVADLRGLARTQREPVRLLQALGVLGRKPSARRQGQEWQVVIFDVKAAWLCRPIEGGEPGTLDGGVPVCAPEWQGPLGGHRKGYTGCGYSLDTGAGARGIDVFRVDWETASSLGFCLLPLPRFLEGA